MDQLNWWRSMAETKMCTVQDPILLQKIMELLPHREKHQYGSILQKRTDLPEDQRALLTIFDDLKYRSKKSLQWTTKSVLNSKITDETVDEVVRENFQNLDFHGLVAAVLGRPWTIVKDFVDKVKDLPIISKNSSRLHRVTALKCFGEEDVLKDFTTGIRNCFIRDDHADSKEAFESLLQRLEILRMRFEEVRKSKSYHDGRVRRFGDFSMFNMLQNRPSTEIAIEITKADRTAFIEILNSCGSHGFNGKRFRFNAELQMVVEDWDALSKDLSYITTCRPDLESRVLDTAWQLVLLSNYHSFAAFACVISPTMLKRFPPVLKLSKAELWRCTPASIEIMDHLRGALPCLMPFAVESAPDLIKPKVSRRVAELIEGYEIGKKSLLLHTLVLPQEGADSDNDDRNSRSTESSKAWQESNRKPLKAMPSLASLFNR